MACVNHVPPLQSLSFNTFYNLVCNVTRLNVDHFRSYILNDSLGIVQDMIREECIVKYNNSCRSSMMQPGNDQQNGQHLVIPDVCTFLDCILNEDFLELKICILDPSFDTFSTVLSVIACRAPELKKLEICFLGKFNLSFISQLTSSSSLLQSLNHLSLTNHGLAQLDLASILYHSLLGIIGKCCPVLTRLEATGFGTMDAGSLRLILNEFLKIVLPVDAITEAVKFLHKIKIQHPEVENLEQATSRACGFLIMIKPCVQVGKCHAATIETVGDILEINPHLTKHVRFTGVGKPYDRFISGISPLELENTLHLWPMLINISIIFLNPVFIAPILKVFGPNLSTLTLSLEEDRRSNKFDLSWLGPCTQLKKLHLISLPWDALNILSNEPVNWTPETYLPMLTEFTTNTCLGNWASLLERKSTLTLLSLNCCHIGPCAHTIPVEWDRIPELWPQLNSLHVSRCTGLTVSKLQELLPQMSSLRKLRLPKQLLESDAQLGQFEGIDIAGVFEQPLENKCLFLDV